MCAIYFHSRRQSQFQADIVIVVNINFCKKWFYLIFLIKKSLQKNVFIYIVTKWSSSQNH